MISFIENGRESSFLSFLPARRLGRNWTNAAQNKILFLDFRNKFHTYLKYIERLVFFSKIARNHWILSFWTPEDQKRQKGSNIKSFRATHSTPEAYILSLKWIE